MSQVEVRLQEAGHVIPEAPVPAANYVPWTEEAGTIFISGQVPIEGGKVVRQGHVGADVSLEEAQDLAALCARNGIANLRAAVDSVGASLDDVRIMKVGVFVAAAPGFTDIHLVANGASDLLGDAFGEPGRHARSAVGVAELPLGVPVEVEITAAIRS